MDVSPRVMPRRDIPSSLLRLGHSHVRRPLAPTLRPALGEGSSALRRPTNEAPTSPRGPDALISWTIILTVAACSLKTMSFNQVIKKKITGTAIKDGSRITLSVATTTTHWTRPDSAVAEVGTLLSRSVAAWQEQLPQDTTEENYTGSRKGAGRPTIPAEPMRVSTSPSSASIPRARAPHGISRCPESPHGRRRRKGKPAEKSRKNKGGGW
ncbi:hypothetical protein JHW43_006913 [Diplocarpon mali]|nr:hypothetical protein JHW43_006913 [Diplocarpon mali]